MRKAAVSHGVKLLDAQNGDCLINTNNRLMIVGCTLWTDFRMFGDNQKQNAMNKGYRCLNDYRRIKENGKAFTPERSVELHEEAIAYLKGYLEFDREKAGWEKLVVVTHHAPSLRSVVEKYKDDLLTACFASNLEDLVSKADLWIHGHTHSSADFNIGKCRVISNPRGYEHYGQIENAEFKPGLVIEI
jgi:Icc-related predicted phosphoesterase